MKQLAIKILAICARSVLRKYQPKIVAITGTVGKSSAKEAVYAVLRHSLVVRASFGSYNNELGVPLSILNLPPPGRNILKWIKAIFHTAKLLFITDHTYPDVLILEMGADRVGDIAKLTSIVPPNVAVLTAITPVHLEKFGNLETVQREKARIWSRLHGVAVGNIDDERVRMELSKVKTKTVTYGISEDAIVRTDGAAIFTGAGEEIYEKIRGVAFKLLGDGSALPVHIPGVLGKSHLYAALAGAATGVAFGLNYHDIVEGLHLYSPLPGRMRLLPGIKHTLLIDDTYNASPAAMESALTELKDLPINEGNKKFACLGDMLELGADSESLHAEVGRIVASSGIDILVCVGERSAGVARAASLGGMAEDHIFHFAGSAEAGTFLQDRIRRGDIILIKGSRGMHLEKVVKELMAEPLRAEELLVH